MEQRWYKRGLIYELPVRTFFDSNGDGVGDLPGVISRLDYLAGLGATCLWLLPFQPSPWRDDGYDITDHYGVHPDLGRIGDFVELVHQAEDRGIRVIVDLVLNHTSNEHPWFIAARDGDRRFRDYYIWADRRPPDAEKGVAFPGVQKTTWSFDRKARRYYFHRFYDFQPDLNIANPEVRAEMERIIGFWVELGVSGFRVDAVPFLIEPAGAEGTRPGAHFEYLHEFRNFLSWRRGDGIFLGEANVERDRIEDYFGIGGMHMLFNFSANQHLWLALAREDGQPLLKALEETAGIPESDQWANFLRNHDEVDLGRLSEDERSDTFRAFAPLQRMQLYGRGIRRRLSSMLGADRRRLELSFSLLFSLPGTPVLYYGDEIGMGDDLSLDERLSVRTPMQWSPARNAGFSTAPATRLALPVASRGGFGYRKVNVADQRRDPESMFHWIRRLVVARTECPEFAIGTWEALPSDPSVVALRYREGEGTAIALHNLASEPKRFRLPSGERGRLVDVFANRAYDEPVSDSFRIDGYGYRWLHAQGNPS